MSVFCFLFSKRWILKCITIPYLEIRAGIQNKTKAVMYYFCFVLFHFVLFYYLFIYLCYVSFVSVYPVPPQPSGSISIFFSLCRSFIPVCIFIWVCIHPSKYTIIDLWNLRFGFVHVYFFFFINIILINRKSKFDIWLIIIDPSIKSNMNTHSYTYSCIYIYIMYKVEIQFWFRTTYFRCDSEKFLNVEKMTHT